MLFISCSCNETLRYVVKEYLPICLLKQAFSMLTEALRILKEGPGASVNSNSMHNSFKYLG